MPISLDFWEWGRPKRRDAHITVTPNEDRFQFTDTRMKFSSRPRISLGTKTGMTFMGTKCRFGIM